MVNIGSKNGNWNGGICYERGYKLIRVYNHPFATKRGYIREHRYIMEKHLGRYLTYNEAIHHINGNRSDNRIENLMLLTHSKHSTITNNQRIYKHKNNPIKTICLKCNSDKTRISNKYEQWYKFKNGYICQKCHYELNKKPVKPKKIKKPIVKKEDISLRICLNCKSNKTFMRKDGKQPIWYKYQDGYLCVKCNGYKRNKNKIKLL